MIGIFVKGGKLPKSCWKCEYGNTDGVSHVCPFYCENHVKQSDWNKERHPQCPLEQMVIEENEDNKDEREEIKDGEHE